MDRNNAINCSEFVVEKKALTFQDILKSVAPFIVIISAIFGNILVILSVVLYRKIRMLNHNLFVLSLAVADVLVAFFVMPFNITQILTNGYWPFGSFVCSIFNSNDVFFSTASIIHLCCISMDRHFAIIHPLNYESIMTRSRVGFMLLGCWTSSILISYIPIFSGFYSTRENVKLLKFCGEVCNFKVNQIYAILSSLVSFWIPCLVMLLVYLRIYKEAIKHEKNIYKMEKAARRKSNRILKNNQSSSFPKDMHDSSGSPGFESSQGLIDDSSSQSVRQGQKLRREHKAAKTLGIIMGCFIICWFPFFLWYSITNLCGESSCPYPSLLIDVLFWIGYANSALNPLIYAFYNREFRNAFRQILKCQKKLIIRNNYALVFKNNSTSEEKSSMPNKRYRSKAPNF